MLAIVFALLGLSNMIRGVSCLTCSFEDGWCGWKHPENAKQTWILTDGTSRHIQSPLQIYPLQLLNSSLVYPNFTGSGFLTFFLSQYGHVRFSLGVGKKTIFMSNYKDFTKRSAKWKWFTTKINASQETVELHVLGASTAMGKVAIDDLLFYKNQAKRCENLSAPVNMSMKCTATNHVGSNCNFACKEGGSHQVIGSHERTCLPMGLWSGVKPLCGKPKLRLTTPTSNSTHNKGIVEILINGKWSKVAISLDPHGIIKKYAFVARAVCRSLGFKGRASIYMADYNSYGYTAIDSWLVLGDCIASAQSIYDCKRSDIARHFSDPYGKLKFLVCDNTTCPVHCFCKGEQDKSDQIFTSTITCSTPASSHVLKEIPSEASILLLRNISFSNSLTGSSFQHLPLLEKITFSNAGIRGLPRNIFSKHYSLREIILDENLVTSLADINIGALMTQACFKDDVELYLSANRLTNITKDSTQGLRCISVLQLSRNRIRFIEEGSFRGFPVLLHVILSDNLIRRIEPNTFPTVSLKIILSSNRLSAIKRHYFGDLKRLVYIDLRNNSISSIEERSFNSRFLEYTDLRFNRLTNISDDLFQYTATRSLYLSTNKLQSLPDNLFKGVKNLNFLDISKNQLAKITNKLLRKIKRLLFLTAMKTGLTEIEDMAFQDNMFLGYLFLDDNKLTRITRRTFHGAFYLMYLTLSSNPISIIEEGAFSRMKDLAAVYLIGTRIQIINIGSRTTFASRQLQLAHSTGKNLPGIETIYTGRPVLRSSGYWCQGTAGKFEAFQFCFPCDQGEYKLIRVFNERGCQKCPPGGFYQDSIAHVGEVVHGIGCKQCPVGTYVSPKNAPGRTEEFCSACPKGTNLKRLAGFRACPCLDNSYRLDRFGSCIQCSFGYKCTNETVNLHPGFYWIWNNEIDKEAYLTFSNKLQVENKDHDFAWATFNNTFPVAYLCPFVGSCEGGIDAKCTVGYEGTLCAVCSKGFYMMYSGCNKCPSLFLFIGQCLAVLIVIGVIVLIIIKEKRSSASKGRSVIDIIFSSLKIIIGFYQVTSATLRAYSYIQWPTALTKLMKFADVVQLNIFKLFPVECVRSSIKITPYVGLVTYVSLDVLVIIGAIGYFYARKFFLRRRKLVNEDERRQKLSICKINCYQAVFLFLFLTYPATCEKVFQVLPAGCTKVCDNQQTCNWYLRSDYSIQCYTSIYNKFATLAYFALVIPIIFPVTVVLLLWKYCRNNNEKEDTFTTEKNLFKKKRENVNEVQLKLDTSTIKTGMRFIYENYSADCWYWEVIELIRKVILTSVLVYSGQHGRLFLGISAIISGFYATFFAYSKPIPHTFEHWLHLGSLVATLANQMMGMLLRIPAETVSMTVNEDVDSLGISILLMFANVFLIGMIIVRYLYGMALSLRKFKDNPECSVGCLLYVLQAMSTGSVEQKLAADACHSSPKDDSHKHVAKNQKLAN